MTSKEAKNCNVKTTRRTRNGRMDDRTNLTFGRSTGQLVVTASEAYNYQSLEV